MKRLLLVAPLLAGVAAVPANAQPLGLTGRAELRAGYDEVRPKISIFDEQFTNHFGVHGVDYGAEVGADFGIANAISLGAYAGVDSSSVDGCVHDIIPEFGVAADKGCVDAGMGYTAGLRAGFDPGGGLIYVKGGYSHAKIDVTYTCINEDACGGNDLDLLHTHGGVGGWHVGAGAELNIGRHLYVKAEYVHTQYKKMFSDLADAADTDRSNLTREQVLLGVGLRFGGASAPPPPPPPPPPVPATQTCPDGTVIDAAAACPTPPPPPPPPPPAPVERGERG